MDLTRRELVAGVSSSFLLTGLLGEIRGRTATAPQPARILFNENPLGPSPKAVQAIEAAQENLCRYPLGQSPQLERILRKCHGMPFDATEGGLSLKAPTSPAGSHDLVLGVGSSEILRAAAWAFGSQGGSIVEAYPGYAAVGNDASRIPGCTVQRHMVPLDERHCIDPEAMIDAIDDTTRIVVICNPNNPTGTVIPLEEIERISNAAPADALVLVDEAYIEFLGDAAKNSALQLALDRKNILISRTFSKIYGMAGLRIGYGISSKSVIAKLRPYMLGGLAMNMAAIVGAMAAVEDHEHIRNTLVLNEAVRTTWRREFPKFGWKMPESSACFCWVDVGHDCSPLVKFLSERGVLVSGGQRWDLPHYVRISVGTEEENDQLIYGIKAFLKA